MWFLIRSAFWLSIVFMLMSWPGQSSFRDISAGLWTSAAEALAGAARAARHQGESACAASPADCLAAVDRLRALAGAASPDAPESAPAHPPAPAKNRAATH